MKLRTSAVVAFNLVCSFFWVWSCLLCGAAFRNAVAQDARTTEVGVVLSLTGDLATIGTAVRNGIEMAGFDQPELFQRIHFQYIDTRSDSATTLTGYQSMLQRSTPSVVLHFGDVMPVRPLIDRNNIAVINFSFESEAAAGSDLIVRSFDDTSAYGRALARAVSTRGLGSLAVVESEGRFFEAMAEGTARDLRGEGPVLRESVSRGQQDFRALIVRFKHRGVRGVGLFMLPEQLRTFARQARELDFHPAYFGTDLFESAAESPETQSLFRGALYPDNQVDPGFAARYKTRYGTTAHLTFAGSGYDVALTVSNILRRSPHVRGRDMIREVMKTSTYHGALGAPSPRYAEGLGHYFAYPIRVKQVLVQGGL
jgi:ABC-type branched-subunit amino acid transport system substrate-binding protein